MKLCSCILATLCVLPAAFTAPSPYSVEQIAAKSGDIHTGNISLPRLTPGHRYTLLFSVAAPSTLAADSRLQLTLADGSGVLASKTLHAGDPDFYTPFQVSQAASPELRLTATALTG